MKKALIVGLFVLASSVAGGMAEDGKALYEKHCAKCHGADGKGETKMGQKLKIKDYTDAKVQDALKDEAAVKAIKEGLTKDGKTSMKAIEGVSDAEIKAMVAHLRTLKK